MASEYAQVLFNLLLILFLIFIILYFLKKFKISHYAYNKHIKIIQALPIGSKEKIFLLEVNHHHLLIGVTSNHIETLHVFESVDLKQASESVDNYSSIAESIEQVSQSR